MNHDVTTRPRLLLVDDDEALVSALELRLRPHFAVTTTTDGHAALALLAAGEPFAAVVADMHMPSLPGHELLAAVQNLAPSIARVLLTGDRSFATAQLAVNDGAAMRLLAKPCRVDEFVAVVHGALREAEANARDRHHAGLEAIQRARFLLLATLGRDLQLPLRRLGAAAKSGDERLLPDGLRHQLATDARRAEQGLARLLDLADVAAGDAEPRTVDLRLVLADATSGSRASIDLCLGSDELPVRDRGGRLPRLVERAVATALVQVRAPASIAIGATTTGDAVTLRVTWVGAARGDTTIDAATDAATDDELDLACLEQLATSCGATFTLDAEPGAASGGLTLVFAAVRRPAAASRITDG